jgi:hypothetical protein
MRPKLQKQSALKLAGRIIPEAKRSGIVRHADYKEAQVELSNPDISGLEIIPYA